VNNFHWIKRETGFRKKRIDRTRYIVLEIREISELSGVESE